MCALVSQTILCSSRCVNNARQIHPKIQPELAVFVSIRIFCGSITTLVFVQFTDKGYNQMGYASSVLLILIHHFLASSNVNVRAISQLI